MRDKFRFMFKTIAVERKAEHSGPSLLLRETVTDSPRLTLLARMQVVFEHGSLQTLIGIVGGLVGTFLDGRYFAILGIWLSYVLFRSGALKGIRRLGVVTVHLISVCFASTALFYMGVRINVARPHVYTPAEYIIAAKAGTPLPITQQIVNQFYPTRTITSIVAKEPSHHSHILVNTPILVPHNDSQLPPEFNVGYSNRGGYVILHAAAHSEFLYGEPAAECDRTVFEGFKKKLSFNKEGTMLGEDVWLWHSFRPLNSPKPGDVLYVSTRVRWQDETGWYNTDFFEYSNPEDHQWHTCGSNNGEQRV